VTTAQQRICEEQQRIHDNNEAIIDASRQADSKVKAFQNYFEWKRKGQDTKNDRIF